MDKNNQNRVEHDYQTISAKPVELKKDYNFFNHNPFFKMLSFFVVLLIKIFVFFIYGKVFRGLKIRGKKNFKHLKKDRFILVSNHMHVMDAVWIGAAIFPKKIYVTMLQSNLGLPVVGKILRVAGGIPIPETKDHMIRFLGELKTELSKKTPVLVMPEAAIKPYHVGIRKFLSGAFRFAVDTDSKILPIVYIYKKPKGLFKYIKKKPWLEMHVLDPITPIIGQTSKESLTLTKDYVHSVMSKHFNTYSDLKEDGYEEK
ncbi:1-acyl-sn-glycerol-3-phosphate acyltransferase [Acholeplasma equirhinis]|uniref:lysophospholipid acyltransferase family protein n=1 Tax=Acholeplasma equirhinis TaxID=555393 RepID=UPI00197A8529|nr:lysophospholipid acyltransferase family protein [Acholeplasma equirhinis]MBN3490300.1 1-acyl-sn-glycerol-3-phosphate acyltransferase [Acholeplasma equirhinis]